MNRTLKTTAIAAIAILAIALPAVAPGSAAVAQTAQAPAAAPLAQAPAAAPLAQATIKALQDALNRQGIAVRADGVFGDETRAAIRQYQSQHHLPVTGEPDKATLDKLGVSLSSLPAGTPAAGSATPGQTMAGPGTGGGMGGAAMMTPEMMQMMQGMMGQGGMAGMMGQGGMAGTMGQGGMAGMMGGMQAMPEAGAGMMGQMPMAAMTMCPMMGAQAGGPAGLDLPGMMGPGTMGPGMMGPGMMAGPGMLLGLPQGAPAEMTEERVRALIEQQLARLGNPRLKLGTVRAGDDGAIVAEIATVDGSLVQKLAFNRYPGLVRRID